MKVEKMERKRRRRRRKDEEEEGNDILTSNSVSFGKRFPPRKRKFEYYSSSKKKFFSSLKPSSINIIIIVTLIIFLSSLPSLTSALPRLNRTSREPVIGMAGEEILIDCRVDGSIDNYTIVWRFSSLHEVISKEPRERFVVEDEADHDHRENGGSVHNDHKKDEDEYGSVLTAGTIRVTSDQRIDVLHTIGNDVWVLRIKDVKPTDSGLYTCELNTNPKIRAVRLVTIESPPEEESTTSVTDLTQVDHNYTSCCIKENVPSQCLPFCTFKGLISEGPSSPGIIQSCIHSLSGITKCLADGRDHGPCCERQAIPTVCKPVCVGNFTLSTVLDHFTCMHYTAPVLACIAEGVSTLPPQPLEVTVDPVSSSELKIDWKLPEQDANLIDSIIVNVTQLDSFDSVGITRLESGNTGNNGDQVTSPPPLYGLQMRFKIPGNDTSFVIKELKPYTMYEMVMFSSNKVGNSLPTNRIRVLTLQPESGSKKPTSKDEEGSRRSPSKDEHEEREEDAPNRDHEHVGHGERESPSPSSDASGGGERESTNSSPSSKPSLTPSIPDTKKCCRDSGTMLQRCVDVLCDPVAADQATLTDLMICAPWANITFKCSASGIDHTSCCEQRGVAPNCLNFCRGSVSRIDFRHFVCLDHLPALSSCILDHHGVLPSPPTSFLVVNVHHDWAILKWSPPKKLTDSVTAYHVHWRQLSKGDGPDGIIINPRYDVKVVSKSPYLLDGLDPGGRYEVYVKSVNKFGTSQGSSRVVFSTPPIDTSSDSVDASTSNADGSVDSSRYNETQCCSRAGLPSACLPLCSYRVKVIDVINLSSNCASYLPTLVRCGAGGRNHIPCCRRRGVADGCLNMCAGLVESSPYVAAARCADELGNMLQCMEEGSDIIPGMPIDFHASLVTKDTIHLEWMSASEDKDRSDIKYQVRFGESDSDVPLHPLEHDQSINSTKTSMILSGLKPETRYSMYVVASNAYGISLPSLVLVINTTKSPGDKKTMVSSQMGPPHSLQVLHQSVDTITLKWLPPLYVPPDTSVSYIVYYKPVNGTAIETKDASAKDDEDDNLWLSLPTIYNTMYLTNLTYNTEYAVTVQAVTGDVSISGSKKEDPRRLESTHSEVILVWTDPAIPASVNLPVIIPSGPITEDSNVTFMCIGIGIPTPSLAMLINGQVVTKDERRHLSLTVIGVKRNLTTVSCYASNGIGSDAQSAQSSLEIRVRFKPTATSRSKVVTAMNGSPARLECEYSGNPQPHVIWYKEHTGIHVELQRSDAISFVNVAHVDQPSTWINSIVFKSVTPSDGGNYSCTVVNELGQDATQLSLTVDNSGNYTRDASACCKRQSVKESCLNVCSFDIDIDAAMANPDCYTEIDKLMACAADGSDHRQCCRRKGVPSDCIRWCAGLKVSRPSLCAISSATDIVSCFEEGRALLPGPPTEVHVKQFLDHDKKVLIEWEPPAKNPELVQWYRVFWRPVGSRDLNRNQTTDHKFELSDLDSSKMYEFVVKSGNHFGLSVFTDPLVISMSTHSVSTHSSLITTGNMIMKIIMGIAITSMALIVIIGAVIYGYKNYYIPNSRISYFPSRRNFLHFPRFSRNIFGGGNNSSSATSASPTQNGGGISFENPSYLKDGLSVHPTDQGPVVQYSNSGHDLTSSTTEVNANYGFSNGNGHSNGVDHLK